MPIEFDPRIVDPETLSFLRACQQAVPFHLGGGAALAGVHLRHRMSADADLFLHDGEAHRDLVRLLPDIGSANGTPVSLIRDAGSLVRGRLDLTARSIELDIVFDPVPDVEPAPPPVSGVVDAPAYCARWCSGVTTAIRRLRKTSLRKERRSRRTCSRR